MIAIPSFIKDHSDASNTSNGSNSEDFEQELEEELDRRRRETEQQYAP